MSISPQVSRWFGRCPCNRVQKRMLLQTGGSTIFVPREKPQVGTLFCPRSPEESAVARHFGVPTSPFAIRPIRAKKPREEHDEEEFQAPNRRWQTGGTMQRTRPRETAVAQNQWDPILGEANSPHFRLPILVAGLDLGFDPWPNGGGF